MASNQIIKKLLDMKIDIIIIIVFSYLNLINPTTIIDDTKNRQLGRLSNLELLTIF